MEIEKQNCDKIDTFIVYLCSVLPSVQSCKKLELNNGRHFPISVLNEDRHLIFSPIFKTLLPLSAFTETRVKAYVGTGGKGTITPPPEG